MRILVIDDDPVVRHLFGRVLVHHDALVVATGAEINWHEQPFELVLCDFDLGPGIDGVAILQQAQQRWPAARRVLMSGNIGACRDAGTPVAHELVEKGSPRWQEMLKELRAG